MGGYRPSGQAAGLCLMLILPGPMAARRLVRVLACAALPFDPAEVHELGAAEVIVDNVGARVEAVQAKAFSLSDLDEGTNGTGCTPIHMAVAIWGRRQPDALAAHDASTASLIFPRALTGGLPWISMHKVSRRVWPGQPSYELDSLSRWRAWAGPRNPFTSPLPSGAEKEAELAAGLLVELLNDPALRDVAESIWLEETERRRLAGGAVENVACTDPVRAALVASSLPSICGTRRLLGTISATGQVLAWKISGISPVSARMGGSLTPRRPNSRPVWHQPRVEHAGTTH